MSASDHLQHATTDSLVCPNCGTANAAGYTFCMTCGASLATGASQGQQSISPAAPLHRISSPQQTTSQRPVRSRTRTIFFLGLLLLLVFILWPRLFSFVGLGSPLPSGAEQVFRGYLIRQCLSAQLECEDAKYTKVRQIPLSEAQRRNGDQDAWCVEFSQLRRNRETGSSGPWSAVQDVMWAVQTRGDWTVGTDVFSCDAMAEGNK